MAHCTQPNCPWKGTKAGLLIHLGRVHKVRKDYDLEFESNPLASESKVDVEIKSIGSMEKSSYLCPVPGCGLHVPDLLSHAKLFHYPEWFLSNGRFVFEVV